MLLLTLLISKCLTQSGVVLFWGEDGLYKLDAASGSATSLLSQSRESGKKAHPPSIGGMCADKALDIVAWTENPSATTIRHTLSVMSLDGTGKMELLTRPGNLYGCTIDSATSTIHFTEFYSQGGVKAHATVLSGGPGAWSASSPSSKDPGDTVPDIQPGAGVYLYGGETFVTSTNKKPETGVFRVVSRSLKILSSTDSYPWKGLIGQGALQSDGTLLVVDSDGAKKSGRQSSIVKVYLDDSQPAAAVQDPSSVPPCVGYSNGAGSLQPSVTPTGVVDEVYALQGNPADTIVHMDVNSPGGTVPVYTGATPSMVGPTGIGPIVWVELETTPEPTTEVPDTPEPTTEAPPTPLPTTLAPGTTEAPGTPEPTTVAPTPTEAPNATAAPATPTPTLTPGATAIPTEAPTDAPANSTTPSPPDDCDTAPDRIACAAKAGCEWPDQSGNCIVYGEMCPLQGTENTCKVISSCYWDGGACAVSENCAAATDANVCDSRSQCEWSPDVGGCVIVTIAPSVDSSEANTLLLYVLIALAVLLLCAIILLCILFSMRSKRKAEEITAEAKVEEPLPPNPLKSQEVRNVEHELRATREMIYNPPPIKRSKIMPVEEEEDIETEEEDEDITLALHVPHELGVSEHVVEKELELHDAEGQVMTENEKELMEKIQESKQDLEMHVALLQDYRSESFRRRPLTKRSSDTESLHMKRLSGATTVVSPVLDGSPSCTDTPVSPLPPMKDRPRRSSQSSGVTNNTSPVVKRSKRIRSWESNVNTPTSALSSPSVKHQSAGVYSDIEWLSRIDRNHPSKTFSSI